MVKEYRSPGAREGGGTQLEAQRNSLGPPWWVTGTLVVVLLGLQAACATGYPMGGRVAGTYRYNPLAPPESPEAKKRAAKVRAAAVAKTDAPSEALAAAGTGAEAFSGSGGGAVSAVEGEGALPRPRSQARRAGDADEAEDWEEEGAGWRDGVGDGRPFKVPMSLDYFQGFLVRPRRRQCSVRPTCCTWPTLAPREGVGGLR